MSELVVTVPMNLWDMWIDEGDLPGQEWQGDEWDFYLYGARPPIKAGERVYIVAHGRLRGYAPLVRVDFLGPGRYSLVRHNGAVAVTIPELIRGFRGWRRRWWEREIEVPFPDWKSRDAAIARQAVMS